jgi:hypothetical protein
MTPFTRTNRRDRASSLHKLLERLSKSSPASQEEESLLPPDVRS